VIPVVRHYDEGYTQPLYMNVIAITKWLVILDLPAMSAMLQDLA
jgi:hypothetical protein